MEHSLLDQGPAHTKRVPIATILLSLGIGVLIGAALFGLAKTTTLGHQNGNTLLEPGLPVLKQVIADCEYSVYFSIKDGTTGPFFINLIGSNKAESGSLYVQGDLLTNTSVALQVSLPCSFQEIETIGLRGTTDCLDIDGFLTIKKNPGDLPAGRRFVVPRVCEKEVRSTRLEKVVVEVLPRLVSTEQQLGYQLVGDKATSPEVDLPVGSVYTVGQEHRFELLVAPVGNLLRLRLYNRKPQTVGGKDISRPNPERVRVTLGEGPEVRRYSADVPSHFCPVATDAPSCVVPLNLLNAPTVEDLANRLAILSGVNAKDVTQPQTTYTLTVLTGSGGDATNSPVQASIIGTLGQTSYELISPLGFGAGTERKITWVDNDVGTITGLVLKVLENDNWRPLRAVVNSGSQEVGFSPIPSIANGEVRLNAASKYSLRLRYAGAAGQVDIAPESLNFQIGWSLPMTPNLEDKTVPGGVLVANRRGQSVSGRQFNGNDFIRYNKPFPLPGINQISTSADFTIHTWLKPNELNYATNQNGYLIFGADGGARSPSMWLNSNNVYFEVTEAESNARFSLNFGNVMAVGNYTALTIVKKGNVLEGYANGVLRTRSFAPTNVWVEGWFTVGGSRNYVGVIDELSIYNGALTPGAVALLGTDPAPEVKSKTLTNQDGSTIGLQWSVQGTDLYVTLSWTITPDTVWAGIGFNATQMRLSDIVTVGFDKDGKAQVWDRKATSRPPPVDAVQNVQLISSSNVNGVASVTFRRPLVSTDADDTTIPIGDCPIIHAMGPGEVFNISYHGTKRGLDSVVFVPAPVAATPRTPRVVPGSFSIRVLNTSKTGTQWVSININNVNDQAGDFSTVLYDDTLFTDWFGIEISGNNNGPNIQRATLQVVLANGTILDFAANGGGCGVPSNGKYWCMVSRFVRQIATTIDDVSQAINKVSRASKLADTSAGNVQLTDYVLTIVSPDVPNGDASAIGPLAISISNDNSNTGSIELPGPFVYGRRQTFTFRAPPVNPVTSVLLQSRMTDFYKPQSLTLDVGPYGQTKKYVVDPVVLPKPLGPSLQWNVQEALLPLSSHYIVTLSVRQYATIPVLSADLSIQVGKSRWFPISTNSWAAGQTVTLDFWDVAATEVTQVNIRSAAGQKKPDFDIVRVVLQDPSSGGVGGTEYRFELNRDTCPNAVNNDCGISIKFRTLVRPVTSGSGDGGDSAASAPALDALRTKVDIQQGILSTLSRSAIFMQFASEQRVSSEGSSGVVAVRQISDGSSPYQTESWQRGGMCNIHDHSDTDITVGMGEFSAVLNGVYFVTRHNDYALRRPHSTSKAHRAVEDLETPDVPPAVLNAGDVSKQVTEMREWFKAWATQNETHRPYKPYFKPALCYLEGTWLYATKDFEEPFKSDRHFVEAANWEELWGKIRYLAQSGRKSRLENLPFLPTAIRKMVNNGTTPVVANWDYRILCHNLKNDLPLNRLRAVPDLHVMKYLGVDLAKYTNSRAARFQINPENRPSFTNTRTMRNFIDELMEQIPGRDNYAANLTDNTPGFEPVQQYNSPGPLNVGYYTRYYSMLADAMGRDRQKRHWTDNYFWAARTSQPDIFGLELDGIEQKWTYAIPLEIIYLTPLNKWNPYNIPFRGRDSNSAEFKKVDANGRNGDITNAAKAYDGIRSNIYYKTPAELFATDANGDRDPADTVQGVVGVLDSTGTLRKVVASGTRIHFPPIPGVSTTPIRQRYPVMPVHEDGNTVWKEVKALQEIAAPGNMGSSSNLPAGVNLELTEADGHTHSVLLTADDVLALKQGKAIKKTSSLRNGHTHDCEIILVDTEYRLRSIVPFERHGLAVAL